MSGQNYIGSKISLISLSDIRYVGILHNINPVESTVALQSVKSYGTEGRKVNPKEEIRPTDNTFDYVVFRGSDIKDLQVFEAPPSFQSVQLKEPVQQPQIIEKQHEPAVNPVPFNYPSSAAASYYPTPQAFATNKNSNTDYGAIYGNTTNYWQSNGKTSTGQSSYSPYAQQPLYQMPVPENYQPVPSAPPATAMKDLNINKSGTSPPTKKEYKEEEKTVASPKKEVPAMNSASTSMKIKLSQEKEEVAPIIEQVDEALLNSLVKQVSDLDIKQPPIIVNKQKSPIRPQKQHQQQPQADDNHTRVSGSGNNGSNGGGRGRRNSTRNPARNNPTRTNGNGSTQESNNETNNNRNINTNGRRNSGNVHRRNSGIMIPKSDFDFESSNARFDKNGINAIEDIGRTNEESIVIPEADHFYDKKKSFFDDISCESKEYQKGNRGGKYKEESKLNLETFGQANPVGQNGKRSRHRGNRGGRSRNHRGGRNKPSTSSGNSNGHINTLSKHIVKASYWE